MPQTQGQLTASINELRQRIAEHHREIGSLGSRM